MKKVLIHALEISIGILFIVLIIGCIKYRSNILDYIKNQKIPAVSTEVTQENNTAEEKPAKENEVVPPVQQEQESTEPPEIVEEEPEQTAKLVFTGDILLTGYLLSQYDNRGITGMVSSEIAEEMTGADLTVVNEEFPFSSRGTAMEDKQFTFRIDPARVNVFQDLGIDLVTLANNHVLDYGREALIDTFETLDNAGIQYVGAGNNKDEAKALKEFELNGKKVGILAASRVIPVSDWTAGTSAGVFTTYDPTDLIEEIKKADAACDTVIVYVHWGVEKSEYPEDYQRELAKQYIDAGADVIIGAHPHVLQGIEYYEGKPIVYSLGNFIFGNQIPKTVLLKLEIGADNNVALQVEACATDASYVLNKASNSQEIYQYLTDISENAVIDSEGVISQKE
ncbi:CapA family protein [Konateibacter massiliensis]|uniref:CapA family protein n=1 Tax=Konateibacter massiliensis TaxID=2002841 RepID=UPI000C1586E3|nr:CapA family protein [Konateibacter massiliensis]